MTNKKTVWLCVCVLVLLIMIMFYTCIAVKSESGGLLVFTPKDNQAKVSYESLEKINMDKIMFTYIAWAEKPVTYEGASYTAKINGTNYVYPYVFGFSLGSGGFFTEDDAENGRKRATLNKTSAFNIFGGEDIAGLDIYISGERYTVSGVIYDGGDENNIYIPADSLKENPQAVIFRIDEGAGMSAEHAVNTLKDAGITSNNYKTINMAKVEKLFFGKAALALYMGLWAFMALGARALGGRLKDYIKLIQAYGESEYLSEIFTKRKTGVLTIILCCCGLAVLGILFILSFIQIWAIVIDWSANKELLNNLSAGYFGDFGRIVQFYGVLTTVLLAAIVVLYIIIVRLFLNNGVSNRGKS